MGFKHHPIPSQSTKVGPTEYQEDKATAPLPPLHTMLRLCLPVVLCKLLLLQETPTVQHHQLQDLLHLHRSQQYLLMEVRQQAAPWKEAPATLGTASKGGKSAATSAVLSTSKNARMPMSRPV